MQKNALIGIVIPYYNAASSIIKVVEGALAYSNTIVIVNDNSPDTLPVGLLKKFKQVHIIENVKNLGVGGATMEGVKMLQSMPHIEVIIKLDADDQMDVSFIPELVSPILEHKAQFVKGNRFRDFEALKQMPAMRRFGNLFLSFLSKFATGYWNCFDFNNGFFALDAKTSKKLINSNISHNYFFETSLICELYFQQAKIKEIAMPAIYGDEKSNMNLLKMPFLFLINIIKKAVSRIWKSYFVYDFNIGSIYILFGFPLFLGGVFFGSYNWYKYASINELTPLGTIMISALLVILGFQLILQAIQYDILKTPKTLNE